MGRKKTTGRVIQLRLWRSQPGIAAWELPFPEFLAQARARDREVNRAVREGNPEAGGTGKRGLHMYSAKAIDLLAADYGMPRNLAQQRLAQVRDRLALVLPQRVMVDAPGRVPSEVRTRVGYLMRTADVHQLGRVYLVEQAYLAGEPMTEAVIREFGQQLAALTP